MKRFFGKTIVALMLFSLVACEESRVFGVVKPDEEDPGQDAGEYATETVYFPKESMDLVIDRNTEGVVRLSASTPREWIPEVGRVFALPRDEAYPLGYFGKVAEIDEGEDGYALRLEEVSIADLFPDTTLVIDVELSSDKLIPLDGDGRSLAQTRAEGVDISGDLTYRVGNAVELSGYFAFEGVRYKSELNTRKGEIYVCTMDVYSDCSFAMDAKLKLEPKELSVFLDDFRYGYVLNDYFGVGIRFDVGAYIHPSFEVDLGLGMEYHANIRAGFDYRDGQVNERCVTENESADMDLTGSARMQDGHRRDRRVRPVGVGPLPFREPHGGGVGAGSRFLRPFPDKGFGWRGFHPERPQTVREAPVHLRDMARFPCQPSGYGWYERALLHRGRSIGMAGRFPLLRRGAGEGERTIDQAYRTWRGACARRIPDV